MIRRVSLARRFGRPRGRRARAGLVAGTVAAFLIAPGLDAASLVWRVSTGCHIWMVVDGDTVRGWCRNAGPARIRLTGFDTPEMRGRCVSETLKALLATYRLRFALWTAGEAVVETDGRDRYGRVLGQLTLDGQNAAGLLVGAGLARPYSGGRRQGWCG